MYALTDSYMEQAPGVPLLDAAPSIGPGALGMQVCLGCNGLATCMCSAGLRHINDVVHTDVPHPVP